MSHPFIPIRVTTMVAYEDRTVAPAEKGRVVSFRESLAAREHRAPREPATSTTMVLLHADEEQEIFRIIPSAVIEYIPPEAEDSIPPRKDDDAAE